MVELKIIEDDGTSVESESRKSSVSEGEVHSYSLDDAKTKIDSDTENTEPKLTKLEKQFSITSVKDDEVDANNTPIKEKIQEKEAEELPSKAKVEFSEGTESSTSDVALKAERKEKRATSTVTFNEDINEEFINDDVIADTKDSDKGSISDIKVEESEEEEIEMNCCDPRQGYYRFVGLFFMCFLSFGSYFCYDTPGSLQDHIKEDMDVSTVQFATLYSFYSWPNVILCFVGGFLIDRVFGVRLGAIIFSSITTCGQFVYAFGAIANQFWMMQLGRFIFGIGCESLAVAQNTYTVAWFKGKELNTVFGLLLSMSRIGSTVNFLVMGPIYNWIDDGTKEGYTVLGITLLIATATCLFSLSCAFILGILDRRRVKYQKPEDAPSGEKIQLKDVLTFPITFWLIALICVTYYVAIFPFIGLAKVFFMRKYDYDENAANGVCSLPYIISAVASPILGFVVDKTGRNVMWVTIAVCISLMCHVLLAFTFFSPFATMFILGIGYSLLASSLWPMVSLILPLHQIATAYGIIQSIQNLGLAVISMLGGLIVDTEGYLVLEIFYIFWLCLALASCIIMIGADNSRGGYLMMSPTARKKFEEKQKEKLA